MSFRLSLVFVCLTVILTVNLANAGRSVAVQQPQPQPQQPRFQDLKVVSNIQDYVRSHPGLKITRLLKARTPNQSVRYALGGRVSGDRLVAYGSEAYAYPAKKDVSITLTYPEHGTSGGVVTYVEIICTQDSTDGNAYVVGGGIGQRTISIVVEANQAETFSYTAELYASR